MAIELVVENGTGLTDANSYSALASANSYHIERGNTAWAAATESDRKESLIKATQYLDGRYGLWWIGKRKSAGQALDWPRRWALFEQSGEYLSDTVPEQVKRATAEAALTAITTDLEPDLKRGGGIQRVTVGPITEQYASGANPQLQRPRIDGLLIGLVRNASGVRLERT